MISEVISVLLFSVFLFLFAKERDLRYILCFIIGFLVTLQIEPSGITRGLWGYDNIAWPFNYMLFGAPISLYLIYSSGAAVILFVTKLFLNLREKNKKLDTVTAFFLIITGCILIFVSIQQILNINLLLGMVLAMVGFFLLVKNPVVLYAGVLGMLIELISEYMIVTTKQLTYVQPYDPVFIGIYFFFGAVILSVIMLIFDKKLSLKKDIKRQLSSLLFAKKRVSRKFN